MVLSTRTGFLPEWQHELALCWVMRLSLPAGFRRKKPSVLFPGCCYVTRSCEISFKFKILESRIDNGAMVHLNRQVLANSPRRIWVLFPFSVLCVIRCRSRIHQLSLLRSYPESRHIDLPQHLPPHKEYHLYKEDWLTFSMKWEGQKSKFEDCEFENHRYSRKNDITKYHPERAPSLSYIKWRVQTHSSQTYSLYREPGRVSFLPLARDLGDFSSRNVSGGLPSVEFHSAIRSWEVEFVK